MLKNKKVYVETTSDQIYDIYNNTNKSIQAEKGENQIFIIQVFIVFIIFLIVLFLLIYTFR